MIVQDDFTHKLAYLIKRILKTFHPATNPPSGEAASSSGAMPSTAAPKAADDAPATAAAASSQHLTPKLVTEVFVLPELNTRFTITFPNNTVASAVRVSRGAAPNTIIDALGLAAGQSAIFITGGAGLMSAEDIRRTQEMIDAVAKFAQEYEVLIIDGGTESGVMQMIGNARHRLKLTFPLIGVAPLGKVTFPGYSNPEGDAPLEDSHSHFVLIEGNDWGDESEIILGLTQAFALPGKYTGMGILINGGKIAQHEVYLAATKQFKLPMLIVEGSGRAADEIATAFKTGRANQRILQLILAGGDIQLVNTMDGPDAMRARLASRFKKPTA